MGATPMIASLSQQDSTASPAAGLLAGLTPTGLGVDLGTPSGQLGASMSISMSELGLTASGGMRKNEDEDRRVKMRKILKSIGRVKGRVGEEGIARVSRRAGFANDIDAEKLSAEERERRVGNRTISIAGNTTVIDVELKGHMPKNVQVLFSSDLAGGDGQSERAASILLQDLQYEKDRPMSATLDSFYENLARIARPDHLSSNRINCFDALSGVYSSLKQLNRHEIELCKADHAGISDENAQTRVMHMYSGRPVMHENRRIGLSLQYWTSSSQIWRQNRSATMQDVPFAIDIETSRYQADLYPPIRVSEAWLADSFEPKISPEEPAVIPWQDPPPTFLAPDADSMTDESAHTLPDVRFVARLRPPIVLPWQVAANMHTALGTPVPPLLQMPSYLSLLLGLPTTTQNHISIMKDVSRSKMGPDGKRAFDIVHHAYELNITKHDVGFVLQELPFSHPRQLIELLPVLRQWACIGALLHKSLSSTPDVAIKQPQVSLEALLDGHVSNDGILPVELTLAINPTPTLSMVFPLGSSLCSPEIQVLENAKLSIAAEPDIHASAAPALEIVQDLSTWVEWMLSRASNE